MRSRQGSFHTGPLTIRRGDAAARTGALGHRIEGEIHIGGQEHFYLETQATIAWLDESGGVSLHSSTQHPSETQEIVARVLGVPRHQVTVECLRMGGAFGGKEMQANCFAAIAALGARKTGRPVRVRLSRRLDMTLTGKRHPFLARFAAGFDERRPPAGRAHPTSTPTAAGASTSPKPSWGAPCSTWTTRTTCRRWTSPAASARRTRPRRRRSAASAGRRACWSSKTSWTASRALSNCRPTSSASAISIAKASPRTTASR